MTQFKWRKWAELNKHEKEHHHPGLCAYSKNPDSLYLVSGYNTAYYSSFYTVEDCIIYNALLYVNKERRIGVLFNKSFACRHPVPRRTEQDAIGHLAWEYVSDSLDAIMTVAGAVEDREAQLLPGDPAYRYEYRQTGTNLWVSPADACSTAYMDDVDH
jgi:hypothetical protein